MIRCISIKEIIINNSTISVPLQIFTVTNKYVDNSGILLNYVHCNIANHNLNIIAVYFKYVQCESVIFPLLLFH